MIATGINNYQQITAYIYKSATLESTLIAELTTMAESPMIGARVPQDWQQQISAITLATGRKKAEIGSGLFCSLNRDDSGLLKAFRVIPMSGYRWVVYSQTGCRGSETVFL